MYPFKYVNTCTIILRCYYPLYTISKSTNRFMVRLLVWARFFLCNYSTRRLSYDIFVPNRIDMGMISRFDWYSLTAASVWPSNQLPLRIWSAWASLSFCHLSSIALHCHCLCAHSLLLHTFGWFCFLLMYVYQDKPQITRQPDIKVCFWCPLANFLIARHWLWLGAASAHSCHHCISLSSPISSCQGWSLIALADAIVLSWLRVDSAPPTAFACQWWCRRTNDGFGWLV